jgi:flagellar biosynthesis protein FlhF
MRLKIFECDSMADALRQIREELGEDAVILESRPIPGGPGQKERIQVFAGVPSDSDQEIVNASATESPDASEGGITNRGDAEEKAFEPLASFAPSSPPPPDAPRDDRVKITPRSRLEDRLKSSGMDAAFAASLIEASDPGILESRIALALESQIKIAPKMAAQNASCIAFIGPTGAGKTTLLAKLAALHSVRLRKKVALVSTDSLRIGGADSLKTYARLIGAPMEEAGSPEEVAEALGRFRTYDLILMDTAGVNPRRSDALAQLRALLEAAKPAETHLILAASSGMEFMTVATDRYGALSPNRLAFTKLDEMPNWGAVASLSNRCGWPISFIADSPEVPNGFHAATAKEIADNILSAL